MTKLESNNKDKLPDSGVVLQKPFFPQLAVDGTSLSIF